jgi:hypothetical protein
MDRAVYRYIDCGHNPVIHYNCREDFCWILKGKNMPLGFKDHQLFTSSSIPLAKGDILFLYSDGITEVLNSNDEPFGIERLIHLIKGFRELDPHELVQRVLNVGFNYSHEGFDDDATSLAIKICHMEQTKRPWGNILFSITEIQTSTIIEKLHQAWVKEDTIYQCKKIKNLPENLITAISCLEAYEQQETSYEDFQSDFEVLHSLDEQQKTSLCESIYWTLRDEELFIEINYIGKSPNTESLDLLHNIFDSITLAEGLGQYKKICGRLFLN